VTSDNPLESLKQFPDFLEEVRNAAIRVERKRCANLAIAVGALPESDFPTGEAIARAIRSGK